MNVLTAPMIQRWPDGEVPFEVPHVWAANDALLTSVDEAIDLLNLVLRGHVTVRSRRPGDRDYLVFRATTQVPTPSAGAPGRRGGAQDVFFQVRSITHDPTLIEGALIREFVRALGVPVDFMSEPACPLTPCLIHEVKKMYPRQFA